MNHKRILIPFSGNDLEMNTLEYDLQFAKSYKAHAEVWNIADDPINILRPYFLNNMPSCPAELYNQVEATNRQGEELAKYKQTLDRIFLISIKYPYGKISQIFLRRQ